MEPLIKRGLPSIERTGATRTNSSSGIWKRRRRRRRRTGVDSSSSETDQDQYQVEGNWPLSAATGPSKAPTSTHTLTFVGLGANGRGNLPLETQLDSNKVASIIMTPAANSLEVQPALLSCCCLKRCRSPGQLDTMRSLQTRDGEDKNRAGNSNTKFNIIINNNNINNSSSSKLLELSKRTRAQHTCKDAPKDDCPETMNSISVGSGRLPEEAGCRLHWPRAAEVEPIAATQGSECLIRTMMMSMMTKTKGRRNNSRTNVWSLTILILIAYELFTMARNYYPTTDQLPSSQRCPPDVIFIRTCMAQELSLPESRPRPQQDIRLVELPVINGENQPQPMTTTTTTTELSSSSSVIQTTATTTNSTTPIIIKETTTSNNNEINITSTINISPFVAAADGSSFSGGSSGSGPLMRSTVNNNNAINKHHSHNVLCNSRCNCVILEPVSLLAVAGNVSSLGQNSSQALLPPPPVVKDDSQQLAGGPTRPSGGQASSPQKSTTTTTTSQQQRQTKMLPSNVNETSSYSQLQQQQQLEQALIAFNEDYSLDSEQQWPPANGNGGSEDGGAVDVVEGSASPTLDTAALSGSDRATPSRPAADQSSAPPAASAARPAADLLDGRRRQASGLRANTTSDGLSSQATANSNAADSLSKIENRDNNSTGTGSSGDNNATTLLAPAEAAKSQTQQLKGLLQVNQSDNSKNNNTRDINGFGSVPKAPDAQIGGGSSKPRLWQLQQASGATHATSSQRQQASSESGMTLFPLPAPHHHRHHHYQPLGPGSGRESSGPQLYAQSLYSSQAPKLSHHAYSPYLKSSSSSGLGGSQQQSDFMTSSGLLNQAGSSAGHQHNHHLRGPGYHLRQTNGVATTSKQRLATNSFPPQQNGAQAAAPIQRLVLLRSLDLSQRLNDSSNKTTTSNTTGAPTTGNASQHYQDWSESKQFAERIKVILDDISQNDIQSLVLRDNKIQFELWSELYALLVHSMRQHLYHLDMSHNSLAKLGITFTGYIEHHLAVHGNWPSSSTSASSSSTTTSNQTSFSQHPVNEILTGSQQQAGGKVLKIPGGGRMRGHNSLLGGGKLYTQVQRLLLSSNRSGGATGTILLQQPLLLRALDLSHNKLKWLINDQFKALKYVQTIRLDYNRIRYINQHAFSGLESLRFLNLNFNRLQVIYIEQFQTNYNLLALMLRSNYLAYLRGGSFASLANLRRLDLSRNKLTIISNNAFVGLESLEMLNCSSNQFVHAPSASLHPLTSLRQLDLSDNLITQLAPGTFFHLPIEDLWLNENEQLVAIERGAFWDLPYLRQLHLKWNPMLMSINNQAFVGTQSLQMIDIEGCQSLELSAKQMLDNITMAATSRLLLRYEQSRSQLNHTHPQSSDSESGAMPLNGLQQQGTNMLAAPPQANLSPLIAAGSNHSNNTLSLRQPQIVSHQLLLGKRILEPPGGAGGAGGNTGQLLKYSYCLAIVCLIVVALKLLFKFTSTSHYLEARRRRRRVYEAKQAATSMQLSVELDENGSQESMSSDGSSSSGSGLSENYPMCHVQPDNHVIAAIVGGTAGRRIQMQSANNNNNNQEDSQEGESRVQDPGQMVADEVEDDENGRVMGCNENNENISVISNSANCLSWTNYVQDDGEDQVAECCGTGSSSGSANEETTSGSGQPIPVPCEATCEDLAAPETSQQDDQLQQPQRSTSTIDMIHSQLIAAGFDYGHANCAHFYQSLGPALQLADMTASFVNEMDFY